MIKGEKFAIVLKSHIIEDGFATFRLTKKEVFYEEQRCVSEAADKLQG